MSERGDLINTMTTARNKLNKIDSAEREKKAKKLVGKCYKLKNSYGSDTENWWMYSIVISTTSSGFLNTLSFQDDERGRMETHESMCTNIYQGHIEITKSEYNRAMKSFLNKISRALTV